MGADLWTDALPRQPQRAEADTRDRALIAAAGLITRDAQDLVAMLGLDETLGVRVCGCCVRLFTPTVEEQLVCSRAACAGVLPGPRCEGCGGSFVRTSRRSRFCSRSCNRGGPPKGGGR